MLLKPKHIIVAAVVAAAVALVMTQKDTKWLENFPSRSLSSSEAQESMQDDADENQKPIDASSSVKTNEEAETMEESKNEQSQLEQQSNEQEEPSAAKSQDAWYMILVNADNTIDQTFKPELADVQNGYQMDKRAAKFAKDMISDAKAQGIDLLVCSGYRSYESQERNFNNYSSNLQAAGYGEAEAVAATSKLIAYPGSSEHQTGLALDIVTPTYQNLDDGYAQTDAAKWLYNHAAEYGFILRYPKDKVDITKISFEPWHYRYVGEEAAQEIMEKQICLEEFFSK